MGMQIGRRLGAALVDRGRRPIPRSVATSTKVAAILKALDSSDPEMAPRSESGDGGNGVDLIVRYGLRGVANQNLGGRAKILGRIVARKAMCEGRIRFLDLHAYKRIDHIGVTNRTRTADERRRSPRRCALISAGIGRGQAVTRRSIKAFPLSKVTDALAMMHAKGGRYFSENRPHHAGMTALATGFEFASTSSRPAPGWLGKQGREALDLLLHRLSARSAGHIQLLQGGCGQKFGVIGRFPGERLPHGRETIGWHVGRKDIRPAEFGAGEEQRNDLPISPFLMRSKMDGIRDGPAAAFVLALNRMLTFFLPSAGLLSLAGSSPPGSNDVVDLAPAAARDDHIRNAFVSGN